LHLEEGADVVVVGGGDQVGDFVGGRGDVAVRIGRQVDRQRAAVAVGDERDREGLVGAVVDHLDFEIVVEHGLSVGGASVGEGQVAVGDARQGGRGVRLNDAGTVARGGRGEQIPRVHRSLTEVVFE